MSDVRTPANRVKNWNGTVHYADLDGSPACGPVATADSWLAPSVATVTCQKCIAHFGEDEPGHVDPESQDENVARRAAERVARREARTTTPEGDEMDESPAEELGRLRRELTEYDPETPEYRMILDRIAVLTRQAAEARLEAGKAWDARYAGRGDNLAMGLSVGQTTTPEGGTMSYEVKTGVKGAMRVNSRTFDTLEEAEAWAARWRRSNSIGSYWAVVKELPTTPEGDEMTDSLYPDTWSEDELRKARRDDELDGLTTYRDATYSAETQELLRELLAELTIRPGWNADPRVHALGEVVSRWDANEATETTL